MRKTIFGRILAANLLTVTFCLLSLGVLLFTFFSNYLIGEQKATLRQEVAHIGELTVFYQDNQSQATRSFYHMNMEDTARRVRGVVFILGTDGSIMASSSNIQEHVEGTLSSSLVQRLLDGEHTLLGDVNGFFRGTYLFVSQPISYHGTTPAVSCVAVPMPNLTRYRGDIFRTVLLSVLLTSLLTCLVSYFVSRRISSPLKRISLAAQSIAKGDFSVEVPVKGDNELATLSETFNQMTYSLKKLEDMRGGFIANVSHELRTPMTTISGFLEGILDNTIPPARQKEYLEIVLAETKRLSRLVNELLLVARMEGGLELKRSSFDMNEAVRIAILRFEPVFTEKNIRADISFDADTCPVFADKDAIDRVLINLFDNALKFNREGGYVRVQVTQTDALATITVENSGEGIREADMKMIWDKFYKTDTSRGQDKTGVGLGLYLVKNIIAAHGGKIYAQSEIGQFTRFVFSIGKK